MMKPFTTASLTTLTSKIISGLILCILVALTPVKSQWALGPLLDLNFSSTALKPTSNNIQSRLVLGVGVALDGDLEGDIDVRIEPMYLMKGWKQNNLELKYSASYIEVPILAKYSIPTNSDFTPYLMAGPSLGYLLSGKVIFDSGSEDDRTDSFKNIDIALALGGGTHIPVNVFNLFVELRYALGLTNVNDVDTIDTEFRNRGFHVVAGVLFDLP